MFQGRASNNSRRQHQHEVDTMIDLSFLSAIPVPFHIEQNNAALTNPRPKWFDVHDQCVMTGIDRLDDLI